MDRTKQCAWTLSIFAVLAVSTPAPAAGAKLSAIFPELAERKSTLGRTALLVDVVLVDDIAGTVEKVKLGESWTLAQLARDTLSLVLRARGYAVDTAFVATIGQSLNPFAPFQSDSVAASGPDDRAHILHAPFYVDPAFADPLRRAVWRKFIESAWNYGRKKNKPPGYLGEPIQLGSDLGYDTIGLLFVVSWGIPGTKQFFAALGGAYLRSTTSYRFLLADAKTGHVLWSAFEIAESSASNLMLSAMTGRATKDLP